MDTVYGLLALAGLFGGIGLAIGLLAGVAVVRWARDREKVVRVVTAVLVVVALGIGIQQTTAMRTEPKNNADARAHDYSLVGLWVGLAVWAAVVNAAGVVVGVRVPLRNYGRGQRSIGPQTQPPIHPP